MSLKIPAEYFDPLKAAIQADRDAGAVGLHEYVYFYKAQPCGYVAHFHGPSQPAAITPDMLPGVHRLVPLDGVEPAPGSGDGWFLTPHSLAELDDFAAWARQQEDAPASDNSHADVGQGLRPAAS